MKLSRPTLVSRLKYLVKNEWVLRKQEDVQWVTYELSEDKAKFLKPTRQQVEEWLKMEDRFKESQGTIRIISPNSDGNIDFKVRLIT